METTKKPRVLSAIQPTSIPTLGNYIGALRNWKNMSADYDCAYAVADLHAITVRQDPKELKRQSMQMFAILLAMGLDPEKSVVFVQSHVDTHTQLAWLLNCYTQFGEASRMTQFKEKSQKHADNINVGLFAYPVLMAADILLYQAHYVPIGADQKQHLEITRDIAERFNALYGNVFTIPEPFIGPVGARVMSLQDPTRKMSKSDPNPKASVSILDGPDVIVKKFKSAVTDSEGSVRFADGKDGINNLMTILSACTGKDYAQIESDFAGKGYGDFKSAVAEAVIAQLRPVQREFDHLMKDPAYLKQCALYGAEKARKISQRTLDKCLKKIGFWIV
ncbi:MAG: tryptophan--tRNA ligase [Oscillospiraceae bacterium]|jgi:tryptophanyl-tRNA synthetase|nr:tryptophan--tRNA ligase [Oscillospiraceae bacterium]